uniref:uncharacterized protein LOC118547797 isoform X3 n=1 Tax=Halichoerus grypus TaxID=9711 RepID=UPI001658F4A4|nr:uncharacterized protein LOC118547797 isoform X3 [Halichoerus grypus]
MYWKRKISVKAVNRNSSLKFEDVKRIQRNRPAQRDGRQRLLPGEGLEAHTAAVCGPSVEEAADCQTESEGILCSDRPTSCVCLHCPGVQLDRAPLWQVPQPGTSALDIQRTVHVCLLSVPLERRELRQTEGVDTAEGQGQVDSRITQWSAFYQLF